MAISTAPDAWGSSRVDILTYPCVFFYLLFFFTSRTFFFQLLDKPWSQVSSLSPPRFLPSIFIAHRVQHSHCSSIFHRVLLTHALALAASQSVRKKKSQRIYTSTHSAGLELTKLTYTRLENTLIRHRGDRLPCVCNGGSSLRCWSSKRGPSVGRDTSRYRYHGNLRIRQQALNCATTTAASN